MNKLQEAMNLRNGDSTHMALVFLCLIIAAVAAYLLMRAGMALFGLVSGYRLEECSVFGLGLHQKADGRLFFGYRRPIRRLCVLLTPSAWDGSSPYRLQVAGGVILLAIVGTALSCLALGLSTVPELLYPALIGAMLLFSALVMLIPTRRSLTFRLRRLRSSVHLRRAREHHMIVLALKRKELGMSEMPEEFFLPYPEDQWHDPNVFIAQANIAFHTARPGHYPQALEMLQKLLTLMDQPDFRMPSKDIYRMYLSCMAAISEMMSGAAPVEANRLYDPSIDLFLGGEWHGQLLIARYLRELLITQDRAAEQQLLNQVKNFYFKFSERRRQKVNDLIQEAQALAAARAESREDTHA